MKKNRYTIIFFLFFNIFFSVMGEKIEPEIKEIEISPLRERAEINIEVTKLKSLFLEKVYVDEKNKNIYIELEKEIKNMTSIDKNRNYDFYLDNEIIFPKVIKQNGKNLIEISYKEEFLSSYIYIKEKNKGKIIKVFKFDRNSKNLSETLIEDRVVVVNLKKGLAYYPNTDLVFTQTGEYNYYPSSELGNLNPIHPYEVEIVKRSGFPNESLPQNNSFINAFSDKESRIEIVAYNTNKDYVGRAELKKPTSSLSELSQFQFPVRDASGYWQHDNIQLRYASNGELQIKFPHTQSVNQQTYYFHIIHRTSNQQTIEKKKHILIINSDNSSNINQAIKRETKINYNNGYKNIGTINFDNNGNHNLNQELTVSNSNGFITGLGQNSSTIVLEKIVNGTSQFIDGYINSENKTVFYTEDAEICFLNTNGNLSIRVINEDNKKEFLYKVYHYKNINNIDTLMYEDTLRISANVISSEIIVEEKEVTLSLKKYPSGYENPWFEFELDGSFRVPANNDRATIKKHNFTEGFINAFTYPDCYLESNHNINVSERSHPIKNTSINHNTSDINPYYEYDITFFNGAHIVLRYYCKVGDFHIFLSAVPFGTNYTFDILHKNFNGDKKLYTLHINDRLTQNFTYDFNFNDIILRKTNNGIIVEQPENYIDITQKIHDTKIFPTIVLGDSSEVIKTYNNSYNSINLSPSIDIANPLGNKINIPITIMETPTLTNSPFFVYDSNNITNGNHIIGSYNTSNNIQTLNRVKGIFKMNFSEDILKVIEKAYENTLEKKIKLNYLTNSQNEKSIHGITGVINQNRQFTISKENTTKSIPMPNIFYIKEDIEIVKKASIIIGKEYQDEYLTYQNNGFIYPNGVISKDFQEGFLGGLNERHIFKVIFPDGTFVEKYSNDFGDIEGFEKEFLTNFTTQKFNFLKSKEMTSFKFIAPQQTNEFIIRFEILNPYRELIKTYLLNVQIDKNSTIKSGEVLIEISNKYNPGNSPSIIINEEGINYPNSLTHVNLISGSFPTKPNPEIDIFIKSQSKIYKLENSFQLTLDKGAIIKFSKEKNGDISFLPLSWKGSAENTFEILYKNSLNEVIENYNFTIKTPDFFIISQALLNFGDVEKGKKNVIGETYIDLQYSNGSINAEYSISEKLNIGNINISNISLGSEIKDEIDSSKRKVKLSATLDASSSLIELGEHEGFVQLIINLK